MQLRNAKGQFTSKVVKNIGNDQVLQQIHKFIEKRIDERISVFDSDLRKFLCTFFKDLAYSYEKNELEWD